MANNQKTPLTKIQEEIDRCNNKNGCNAYCSKAQQALCPKLIRHSARMDFCREKNMPIHMW